MIRRSSVVAGVVGAATLATLTVPVSQYAVWNTTASVPTGLYAISSTASLHVGERVALEPPPELRRFLAARGYLPATVPLIKRIAAVRGQRVCRFAHGVTVDGTYVGAAHARDRLGRPLPVWFGCQTLRSGEIFVMNPAAPDSFDGRYFGVLHMADVIGRATPVWTDEAGNGDHVWFADPRTFDNFPNTNEGERPMRIGTFVAADGGFVGHLHTLTLDIDLVLLPADPSDSESAPDFRVIAGEGDEVRDVGAGWKHVGERAGDYVAIQFDDPAFIQPLRANLFKSEGNAHVLLWSRPSRREKADCAMRRFRLGLAACTAIAFFSSVPASGQAAAGQAAPRVVDIASHVAEASRRFGIPEHWIYAVMRTESAGRISAVSLKGAMGLMQLMPGTWARQRTRFGLGADPFEPRDNILAGASYLREMYDSYGASGFLAAYNAGPGRYEDWRDRGRPLPAETRAYVAKIAPAVQSGSAPTVVASAMPVQPVRRPWTQAQLFSVRRGPLADASSGFAATAPPAPGSDQTDPLNGLFAPVSGSRSQ